MLGRGTLRIWRRASLRLVFCIYGTFTLLSKREDRIACLRFAAAALNNEGILAIEVRVPFLDGFVNRQRITAKLADDKNTFVDTETHDPLNQTITSTSLWFSVKTIRRWPQRIRLRLSSRARYYGRMRWLGIGGAVGELGERCVHRYFRTPYFGVSAKPMTLVLPANQCSLYLADQRVAQPVGFRPHSFERADFPHAALHGSTPRCVRRVAKCERCAERAGHQGLETFGRPMRRLFLAAPSQTAQPRPTHFPVEPSRAGCLSTRTVHASGTCMTRQGYLSEARDTAARSLSFSTRRTDTQSDNASQGQRCHRTFHATGNQGSAADHEP